MKIKQTSIFLFLSLFLIGTISFGQNKKLKFRSLSVDQGLSHTDATCIVQDKKGFIWIGTYGGLDRYDGYDVKNYFNDQEGLNNAFCNRINSLQLVNEAELWLKSEGGIRIFDLSREKYLVPKFNEKTIEELHGQCKFFVANSILYLIDRNGKAFSYTIAAKGKLAEHNSNLRTLTSIKGFTQGTNGDVYCLSGNDIYAANSGNKFTRLVVNRQNPNALFGFFISVDELGNLWLSQGNGLAKISKEQLNSPSNTALSTKYIDIRSIGKLSQISTEQWNINDILTETSNTTWVASSQGLYKIIDDVPIEHYVPDDFDNYSLTSPFLTSFLLDRSGIFWATSFAGGVVNTDFNIKKFGLILREPLLNNTLSGYYVRAIKEDSRGNIWIGTQSNGLNLYNSKTKQFRLINGLSSKNIRAIQIDKKENIWVASDGGIDILSIDGKVLDHLENGKGKGKSLANKVTYTLDLDVYGRMWAGSWDGGLSIIDYKSKQDYTIETYTEFNGLSHERVTSIYCDPRRPEVFVSTTNGLNHFYLDTQGKVINIKTYQGKEGQEGGLLSNYIWPVIRQNENTLWVGTIGGGFCKLNLSQKEGYTCKCYTEKDGLPSNDIEGMLIDEKGHLWLSGKGIMHFDPETETFQIYDVNDGLQGNSFKIGSSSKGKDGKLYFGGINGLNYFYPEEIIKNSFDAEVQITDILINNQKVIAGDETTHLSNTIAYTEEFDLDDDQNNFVFSFSAMHFANPQNCLYRYKLEGFDKDWVLTSAEKRYAAYSNLEYSTYTFSVEASNNDGVWSGKIAKVTVNVLPPWYKSNLAKFIWFLLACGLSYFVYLYQKRWFGLKRKLEWQQLEEKKAEELHKFRMHFFTNISHDFRTPLSLILGPLENLLSQKLEFNIRKNYYQTIQRNAQRLLGLINELMDFQKVELGSIKLKTQPSNINIFVREIASEFYDLAQRKDISFSINAKAEIKNAWFDRHVLEKILVNLLSNAFKYTEANGAVEVEVLEDLEGFKPVFEVSHEIKNDFRAQNYFYIRIADTGIGITEQSLKYIFERYFRIADSDNDKHLGSGVGLALVKSMVFLHKGDVFVSSKRNMGTEFVLGFPASEADYEQENFEAIHSSIKTSKLESGAFALESAHDDKSLDFLNADGLAGIKKPKILVAEDNDEMQIFIVQLLREKYEVHITSNGAEAYDAAQSINPDLILSDVMMPVMDGNQLCEKVKSDLSLSHIPFILLTAKQSKNAQIEGTQSGADAYLTKPFSPKLLHLTIGNLLESREKLRQWYSQNYFAEARELATNKKDEDFIQQLSTFVEDNVENTELDIELICKELGMSRTNLYNKIKGITGESIGEFIRDFKLKKAAKLLLEEDTPVVQVMYQVGIQSQSYFTKAFKKKFGKTPTAFVKSYSKAEN